MHFSCQYGRAPEKSDEKRKCGIWSVPLQCEAIGLIGLTYINNIIICLMINSGAFDSTIAPRVGADTAWQIKNLLIATPAIDFLVGGMERVLAITVQIAFSLVVLYGVMNRKAVYVAYAILLHAALNAPAAILFCTRGQYVVRGALSFGFCRGRGNFYCQVKTTV